MPNRSDGLAVSCKMVHVAGAKPNLCNIVWMCMLVGEPHSPVSFMLPPPECSVQNRTISFFNSKGKKKYFLTDILLCHGLLCILISFSFYMTHCCKALIDFSCLTRHALPCDNTSAMFLPPSQFSSV